MGTRPIPTRVCSVRRGLLPRVLFLLSGWAQVPSLQGLAPYGGGLLPPRTQIIINFCGWAQGPSLRGFVPYGGACSRECYFCSADGHKSHPYKDSLRTAGVYSRREPKLLLIFADGHKAHPYMNSFRTAGACSCQCYFCSADGHKAHPYMNSSIRWGFTPAANPNYY